ncbi:MAG TPA: outer membrane beta-barrel protein [Ferruginibacter sp.]|nr:outer membrane beta-barrel protein [Ferruginibacter sp.]
MKKIFLFFLLSASVYGTAQPKISFTAFAGSNFTTSGKTEESFNTIEHYVKTRSNDTFVLGKNYFNYSLRSSYTGKYGFSLGVKANLTLTDHIGIAAGIGISKSRIKRNNYLSYKLTKSEQITVVYTPPPGGVLFSLPGLETTGYEKFASYYYYVYEENISMVTLQIPVEMVFCLGRKGRFDLRLGATPTLLLNYELIPNKTVNPELSGGGDYRPKPPNSSENKFHLTACAGFRFPVYRSLSANVYYNHFFNTVTQGTVIPSLTPHMYGVSLVYQLPNFKQK